jgi:hypothetical protein
MSKEKGESRMKKTTIMLMLVSVLTLSGCLPQMAKPNDPEWVYQNTKVAGDEFSKGTEILGARVDSGIISFNRSEVLMYVYQVVGVLPENGYYKYIVPINLNVNKDWIFFDTAKLPGGKDLKLEVRDRAVDSCRGGCLITEGVIVVVDREDLCPGKDLRIMLYGRRGSQLVVVPDTYLQGFWKVASQVDKGYAESCKSDGSAVYPEAASTPTPISSEVPRPVEKQVSCGLLADPEEAKSCYAKRK